MGNQDRRKRNEFTCNSDTKHKHTVRETWSYRRGWSTVSARGKQVRGGEKRREIEEKVGNIMSINRQKQNSWRSTEIYKDGKTLSWVSLDKASIRKHWEYRMWGGRKLDIKALIGKSLWGDFAHRELCGHEAVPLTGLYVGEGNIKCYSVDYDLNVGSWPFLTWCLTWHAWPAYVR